MCCPVKRNGHYLKSLKPGQHVSTCTFYSQRAVFPNETSHLPFAASFSRKVNCGGRSQYSSWQEKRQSTQIQKAHQGSLQTLSTGLTVFGAERSKQPHVKDNYAKSGTSGTVTSLKRIRGAQETQKKLGSERRTRTGRPLNAK